MTGAQVDPLDGGDPEALGPYRLLGRLASGGMGRIYLARGADGRLAAVKTLLAEGVVSQVDRRRFEREVTLAQRVDSDFTARVRDADSKADRPWMAIDYIAAPSLSQLVRTAGVLPASAVRWLAAGTSQALVTLHEQGVVHRDVKPQNILLPLAGPRVIDFGISHANDITRTSLTLGTIAFTSPEQARGERSTAASDVYSLGATLFHLALGRPPYRADGDTLVLLARVQRGELHLDGLPKELVSLIRPCLEVEPGNRPRPAELLARFRESLAGLPASQDGGRWLPQRWTSLITAYERQGERLARGGVIGAADPGDGADGRPTDVLPPQGPPQPPTRVLPEEQARREREREERGQREREERERLEREKREGEQREKRERKDRAERERRERAERARRDRAHRERREREERARLAAAARARASGSAQPPQPSAPDPAPAPRQPSSPRPAGPPGRARSAPLPDPSPPAPPRRKPSNWSWLFVPLVVVLILYWMNSAEDSGSGGSGPGSSGGSVSGTGLSGTGTGSGTGGGAPPEPTPGAADAAFLGVSGGDCLTAYDDGYGNWSTDVPRKTGCDAADAYLRVTSAHRGAAGSKCPDDVGASWWYHSGSRAAYSTTLCVVRQFRTGQCFVAERTGREITDSRPLTVWSCTKDTVPEGYNAILQITARYRSQSSYPAGFCAQNGSDRNYYWYYEVDDGEAVICLRQV
ncbi:serine/threonine-protein kinase [Streptomyces nitrosporeus]|uniref:serine/threonine-protein kinase n=1 Tax=Streptomyces nitrosporeus TaxID=28894 RepID=UPI00331B5CF3